MIEILNGSKLSKERFKLTIPEAIALLQVLQQDTKTDTKLSEFVTVQRDSDFSFEIQTGNSYFFIHLGYEKTVIADIKKQLGTVVFAVTMKDKPEQPLCYFTETAYVKYQNDIDDSTVIETLELARKRNSDFDQLLSDSGVFMIVPEIGRNIDSKTGTLYFDGYSGTPELILKNINIDALQF